MGKDRKVIIIGHRNPDTDSICSAVAYAYLKNKINGGGYEACRAGEISQETEFVLKRFKIKCNRSPFNVNHQNIIPIYFGSVRQKIFLTPVKSVHADRLHLFLRNNIFGKKL